MESNFIKERVVVRDEIIKKNIEACRLKKPASQNYRIENPSERLVVIEELINEGLRQDLAEISKQVESTCDTIAEYLKIKSTINVFKLNPADVRVQSNLGCNFYSQCKIADASKIYLCIGQDYFLHMEINEALKMIDLKEKQLVKRLDNLQAKASKIKSYIKIALEAMDTLYEIDS